MNPELIEFLKGMETRLSERYARLEQRMDDMQAQINELRMEIREMETRLLTEFHKWASPQETTIRRQSAATPRQSELWMCKATKCPTL